VQQRFLVGGVGVGKAHASAAHLVVGTMQENDHDRGKAIEVFVSDVTVHVEREVAGCAAGRRPLPQSF